MQTGNFTFSLFRGRFLCSPCPVTSRFVNGALWREIFEISLLSGEVVLVLHVLHGTQLVLEAQSEAVQCCDLSGKELHCSWPGC